MPKRRTFNFKPLQGSSASGSKNGASNESTASVNERLSELRKLETPEALQKKRELAALANQPSVPPELRDILGVPESAPPKPKIGVRLREMRRTPGPAPPKSWLGFTPAWQPTLVARGGKGRKPKAGSSSDAERSRPSQLLRFDRKLAEDQNHDHGELSGLLHLSLKRLAEQWDLFDEEDYPELIEIPFRLRIRLLSYLGYYGPPIDATALRALTAGTEPLLRLDLAGLAGHGPLTMKKLVRLFEPVKRGSLIDTHDQVLDSWDSDDTLGAALTASPIVSRFASLTHLSLSDPPATASWRDLLVLSRHVPQLTHLSLANWSRPTLTPNLAGATVSSHHQDVHAGGSHHYSGLDQDFTEPASLLRQLSSHLLCLQWLDLEGCAEWMPALAVLSAATPIAGNMGELTEDDGWSPAKPTVITIFTDTWRNLNYINCAQGWLPSASAIEKLNSPTIFAGLEELSGYNWRKYRERFPDVPSDDYYETDKRKARIWLEREQRLFAAGRRINNIRRARSCRPVIFDLGWLQRAVW